MDKADKLTIKEAAAALKCSSQTIRRRIAKGEIPAKKEMTEFGEVWFIPTSAIHAATQTVEVVPVTRNITPAEIGQIVESAVSNAVAAQVESIKEEMRQLRAELEAHNRRVDERLREAVKPKEETRGFWSRLFNK